MALPSISVRDAFVVEPSTGSTRLQFRITLDQVATTAITIAYSMVDQTAMGASDYDRGVGTISIEAGQQEVVLPVSVFGDTVAEGDERFSLVLTSATNAVFTGGAAALQVTGSIVEGTSTPVLNAARAIAAPVAASGAGALPTLDVRNVAVFEGDSGSSPARFLVMLDKVATAPVTFTYYTQDATASSGRGDYFSDARTFTIAAGQQSAFIGGFAYGDTANEGNETFNLVVTNVSGARLANNAAAAVATATIIDGDDGLKGLEAGIGDFSSKIYGPASMSTTLPTMAVSSPSVIEGDSGSVRLRYLVTFDRPLTSSLSVNALTQDGTAVAAGGDYFADNRTITFAAGTQSSWIDVIVYGDTRIEGNETVQLILSGITNGMFDGGAAALVATGTIIDDDGGKPDRSAGLGQPATQVFGDDIFGSPTLTVVSTSIAEGDSGSVTAGVYVLLSKPSQGNVTFRYDTIDGTATAQSDYAADGRVYAIPAGQTSRFIPLTVYGDTAIEGDEAFTVRLSNLSGAFFASGGSTATARVLIRDNDGGGTAGQQAGPEFTRIVASSGGEVLFGAAGADTYTGGAGNDRLVGAEGNDTLSGRGGNDLIEGGSGYDTGVWTGTFRQYAVSGNDVAGFSVRGIEGNDTVTGIEKFAFADGVFIVDPDSTGAQVQRMYDTVFGRAPDALGLDYWIDRIEDAGATLSQVAVALAASPEFQQATGGLGNGAFVDYVYAHALGRAPDASGRSYWQAQLDQGLSRGDMLVGFSESAEHRARTADLTGRGYFQTDDTAQAVALLYDSFVGRQPDRDGLVFWTGQIKSGAYQLAQVADAFAVSPEYRAATQGKTNAQLVDFMYQNTLDRAPDAGGRAYWTDQLDRGLSKGQLLLEFSQSPEHAGLLAAYIIGGIDILM